MTHQFRIVFATIAALGAFVIDAGAQTPVPKPAATSAPGRGFGYGWNGGITVLPNGDIQMAHYPTVTEVRTGSRAEAAGLLVGDTIVAVNGQDARQPPALRDAKTDKRIVLRVRRNGGEREFSFVPAPPQ